MNRPEEFQLITDYATLKNDSGVTVLGINIVNGDTVPAGNPGTRTYQQIVTVGSIGAPIRARMRHANVNPDWVVCSNLITETLISYPGFPVQPTAMGVGLERISPTQVRLYALFTNFNPGADMTIRRDETIQCEFTTFLSPFN